MWPMARSPRNDARPLVAIMSFVDFMPVMACSDKLVNSCSNSVPFVTSSFKRLATGMSVSNMVFSPKSALPRCFTASTP